MRLKSPLLGKPTKVVERKNGFRSGMVVVCEAKRGDGVVSFIVR